MLSIELPTDVEQHLKEIVQKSYHGDVQIAISSFLRLHEKYGWKEQFREDVNAIRNEVRRQGGVSSHMIDDAINRYRKQKNAKQN
jgi:hypothetical protein